MNAVYTYTYDYDGNGNVTDIVGTNGTSVAHYEYDPFGRTVAKSGTFAEENNWQFSTKSQDESGLYYYGYRYYSPELGRWLSRDRINEKGGLHLYAFVLNNATDGIDPRGSKRLTLSYDMADDLEWWDWFMDPLSMKLMDTWTKVLADIEAQMTSEPCNCIEHLTLAGHGKPGTLWLGDMEVSPAMMAMWEEINAAMISKGKQPQIKPEEFFFEHISSYLCEDESSVKFVTCSSGSLPEGEILSN